MPFVKLTAPSGEVWSFGEDDASNCIEGSASEFCQVVTQTRNVKDTSLAVIGPVATDWMSKAQCFAGGRNDPPEPGTRFRAALPVPETKSPHRDTWTSRAGAVSSPASIIGGKPHVGHQTRKTGPNCHHDAEPAGRDERARPGWRRQGHRCRLRRDHGRSGDPLCHLTGAGRAFSAGGDVKAMQNKTGAFGGKPHDIREATAGTSMSSSVRSTISKCR